MNASRLWAVLERHDLSSGRSRCGRLDTWAVQQRLGANSLLSMQSRISSVLCRRVGELLLRRRRRQVDAQLQGFASCAVCGLASMQVEAHLLQYTGLDMDSTSLSADQEAEAEALAAENVELRCVSL
jgi:hypothetical protein